MAKLTLVGLGPGSLDLMSLRARQAIIDADVVAGYRAYVDLIQELIDKQDVIQSGMTREWDRAAAAVEQAKAGRNVVLVCSGDAGMYAMAPLVLELLTEQGWNAEQGPAIDIIPGITAANACASLVGAPLGHDSCTISLSDLLTPWPVIEKRIHAAADADFAITFYNPRSRKRKSHIESAQRILLQYREPATPVAVVNAAYRDDQHVALTTLAQFTDLDFGMNAAVIVGNSSSFQYHDWIVTPRGYRNKYQLDDGVTLPGQKRGHALATETSNREERE
ncbi:precorrin-3B C(17)-methyltransferase [Photobacterium chitinilyticum]|uniref:Precorrin-3B C(17)-methyltransferase n=1 Tax=Photobacterium chitinilyticum TaxID=2485123 RepID=A0A3S3R8C8_9GAMM|nr:precorrin-3B C(17)-methyltransferase [Photobacterium chitinilyticum]RWX54800.1 precorrin-3B C(17)-methyltransferase [Photobacterium chitinilyticum]